VQFGLSEQTNAFSQKKKKRKKKKKKEQNGQPHHCWHAIVLVPTNQRKGTPACLHEEGKGGVGFG
jgi:hypothetical protein